VGNNTVSGVIEYTSAGALVNTYTPTGINGPRRIAFDSIGNLWVPNSSGSSMLKLSSAGALLATVTVGMPPRISD